MTFLLFSFAWMQTSASVRPLITIVQQDTIPAVDTLRYPIQDRRGDKYSVSKRNPFDLNDPSNISDSISYDPKTKEYYIIEKIGGSYFRKPTSLSFDEFMRLQARRAEREYFQKRANTSSLINRKLVKPKMNMGEDLFNRLFGNGKIDIKPQGEVTITAGYQGQNIKNPTLPERARRNGGLDFDMAANLNVLGNIGDKMKFPISYNTLSTFDFENQLKLDYTGGAEDIFKKIEVGNTTFASKGTLIPGAQQLFGVKTQLQFGKLWVSTVFANQRSQRQSAGFKGGSSTTPFEIKADEYEENRHFLLAQHFRRDYNKAMKNLPIINSQVQLLRLEVWVTNRMGATTNARDVVGLMDLAEDKPYQQPPIINPRPGVTLPSNGTNDLYSKVISNPSSRNPSQIVNHLNSLGLLPVRDFEKTFARKLDSSQYYFNRQLGFISLNVTLQPDEVLAVAYQYTVNGRVYQVGEFAQDIPVDTASGVQNVLFLKLLKGTSQRTALPMWDLMMKNIYPVGYGQLERQDFQFNVLYQEPGGGEKRYIPEGDQAGVPLITLLNLDRLNNQNDPQPDGVFDFVEGYTVNSNQSRVIFPVLEPFGRDLEYAFTSDPSLREKYLFYPLYDTIKAIAQTYANLNRFIMKGTSKSSGGSTGEISLNAFNIPQGSVTVTAGGQTLQENVDYTIDYLSGTLRIINSAITQSGLPVNVQFENNATFGVQQRTYMGLRWDYLFNEKFSIGGSMVRLSERPFFTKMEYGSDPIRNSMTGLDLTYNTELPRLNKWLSKLPFYEPTGTSSISVSAEAAKMTPGHAPQIGKGGAGLIYLDDFEGTKASIDLRFPIVSWTLASTPFGATDKFGNIKFPEASAFDNINYGKNRAKLAWYNIEPILQEKRNQNNPVRNDIAQLSDPRVRSVGQQEIFPRRTPDFGQSQLVTFDLAYYPKERGHYNYDAQNIESDGKLKNPKDRWGGIMRGLDQTDFETANIEFIEFWVLDPFIKNTNPNGGSLYFNLGNISEDILKDSRRFYENGLPTPTIPSITTTSNWGNTPLNPIQVTQGFSNTPSDRPYQDVGLDGLSDSGETQLRSGYLSELASRYGTNSTAYQKAAVDPSSDNFKYYRDETYDAENAGILTRYKNFNNPQGNSPVAKAGAQFASAFTLYPDGEDLNRDNTLNEAEEYFQYRIDIKPAGNPIMQVGQNFIADKKTVNVTLADGTKEDQIWYQFRVPIAAYENKVGEIPDFKSIRFFRMFLTDFEDSTVLRFAKLDLVRNNWRRFAYEIDTTGAYKPIDLANSSTLFNVSAVNIEENDRRNPIPYRIPPGIERVQTLSNGGINILQNEQSLSMNVINLQEGDGRAVFKSFNHDLRQYGRISMFYHAESLPEYTKLNDGEVYAVLRIGNDYINNYYEIKYPLKITPFGTTDERVIWPEENELDFELEELVKLKNERNLNTNNTTAIYRKTINGKIFSIMGNPNLGEVRGILAGIENAKDPTGGRPVNVEAWINELRLSGLNEKGGWAAVGQMNLQLADLGSISMSTNIHTIGFGQLEQRVNDRYRDDYKQFDFSTNLQLGKLLPKKLGLEIPFFANISQMISAPEFDPYDKDIKLRDKLELYRDRRDSIRRESVDFTGIKTFNFTNVRFTPKNDKKIRLWSISNFDFSYSVTQTNQRNPLIERNQVNKSQGGIGYNYNAQPKYIEPFKKLIKTKTPWLDFIKNVNFNPLPSLIGVRLDTRRQFGAIRPRNVGGGKFKIPETYDKYFIIDRNYNMRWDLTRSLNVDFKAVNNSRVDEPIGRIDSREKMDSLRRNFFKGGRNTMYTQNADITYNIPTSGIPILDWTTVNLAYRTTYNWVGASRLAVNLGNTIQNSNQIGGTAEFNFTQLYNKSRLLRAADQIVPKDEVVREKKLKKKKDKKEETEEEKKSVPTPTPTIKRASLNIDPMGDKITMINPGGVVPGTMEYNNKRPDFVPATAAIPSDIEQASSKKQQTEKDKKESVVKGEKNKKRKPAEVEKLVRQREAIELNRIEKALVKTLTAVKRIGATYNEGGSTFLPGYTDSTKFLGQNWRSMAPGIDFIMGKQPNQAWLQDIAQKGLITRDPMLNNLFVQNYDQKLNLTAQVEPLRDFLVDLNLDKSISKNFSTLFKDTVGTGQFNALSAYGGGGFSISFISFQTLFGKFDPNVTSETFKKFEGNRKILSERLGQKNPYSLGVGSDGYYKGYGRYAQDVLIPSFVAAYTNKDPNSVSLIGSGGTGSVKTNPFKGYLPKPNWRVTYSGLSRIESLQQYLSNFTLSHGYNSTLSMNSFNTALLFQDTLLYGFPSFMDSLSGNFIPYFLVPNLLISEQFAPLIGIDFTTPSQWSGRIEYRKSRQLSLSLIDFQLSEIRSTEITFGMRWRKRGMPLPFRLKIGKDEPGSKTSNDVTFALDFSIRDDINSNSRLDQSNAFATGGQKVISIRPTIDYVLSNRINLQLYFDQRRMNPYISNAAPSVNTRGGLQVRISLAQ
ncbi:MAG: cell surface protein SprA [bacterium]